MSAHLIPNTEFLKFRQTEIDGRQFVKVDLAKQMQIDDLIRELEQDIKNKMEYNWKLIYALDDVQYQRDVLYTLLAKMEDLASKYNDS